MVICGGAPLAVLPIPEVLIVGYSSIALRKQFPYPAANEQET
jgi:hypothetical protein